MKRMIVLAVALASIAGHAWGQKPVDRASLLQDPEWKKVYDDYVPDAGWIASLRKRSEELRVDVYFAFWCSDSLNHVPVFLKIMDAVNAPGFQAAFYEVERKALPEQKYYVEGLQVERVPTFIFYAAGGEIGRIVENPSASILEDILAIASGGQN
ncbi:MAG: thioredoxin family protein [Acidobacteria bacterium]|jgi:hypothetical protein|nr:thioredoxin family protein [Acidobacteriota bacterium]